MGDIRAVFPVRPLAGLLAAEPEWLQWAEEKLIHQFGPVKAATPAVQFTHTTYYAPEMGAALWRRFVVFSSLVPPDGLADWKQASNRLEAEAGQNTGGGRRINVDPGYLAPGKLVLASTKDHEQRLYLRDGIYAEVTLRVRHKHFQAWPWTYPDYAEAIPFFEEAYHHYLTAVMHHPPAARKGAGGISTQEEVQAT